MKPIPYGHQDITEQDIAAVRTALESDWLTQGPTVEVFERAVAEHCGGRWACAVNSATSALHLACRAIGLREGDWLWTTPNTFVASSNAALYCRARVDFVDIDAATYNISVSALKAKLAVAEKSGWLPKAVMPMHFGGQSCDMREIGELAKRYGFRVIEDASHAVGGSYRGRKIGCCEFSDLCVFSFHPVKIVTTGEGGMVLTNDATLHETVTTLRSHGITRDPRRMSNADEGAWYYEQIDLGFNYRMTEIQAALGVSQLQRIDAFVARRKELADRYDLGLAGLPIAAQHRLPDAASSWHLYVIQLDEQRAGKTRRAVFDAMRAAGINVNVHYIPVHLQPYYRNLGFGPGDFPIAERYYQRAITLPLFPGLGFDQQDYVIAMLRSMLS